MNIIDISRYLIQKLEFTIGLKEMYEIVNLELETISIFLKKNWSDKLLKYIFK